MNPVLVIIILLGAVGLLVVLAPRFANLGEKIYLWWKKSFSDDEEKEKEDE